MAACEEVPEWTLLANEIGEEDKAVAANATNSSCSPTVATTGELTRHLVYASTSVKALKDIALKLRKGTSGSK